MGGWTDREAQNDGHAIRKPTSPPGVGSDVCTRQRVFRCSYQRNLAPLCRARLEIRGCMDIYTYMFLITRCASHPTRGNLLRRWNAPVGSAFSLQKPDLPKPRRSLFFGSRSLIPDHYLVSFEICALFPSRSDRVFLTVR